MINGQSPAEILMQECECRTRYQRRGTEPTGKSPYELCFASAQVAR